MATVESRPKVSLTEAPEITIGDINDITGTIADKDRYLLNTGGTRINPATEDTLSSISTHINMDLSDIYDKLVNIQQGTGKLDVDLSTRASESTLSGIKSQTDKLTFDGSNNLQVRLKASDVSLGGASVERYEYSGSGSLDLTEYGVTGNIVKLGWMIFPSGAGGISKFTIGSARIGIYGIASTAYETIIDEIKGTVYMADPGYVTSPGQVAMRWINLPFPSNGLRIIVEDFLDSSGYPANFKVVVLVLKY